MKSKFENLWYYHKFVIILCMLIVISGIYLGIQTHSVPDPDYFIAVVEPDYSMDSSFSELSDSWKKIADDRNNDGEITVKISAYHVVLGADNQDFNEISALDADLTGKVSALFILSDPKSFESATNGIIHAEECEPVRNISSLAGIGFDDFYAAVRPDHPQASDYQNITFY